MTLTRGIKVNDIHPVIDTVFPLDQVEDGYRRLEKENM